MEYTDVVTFRAELDKVYLIEKYTMVQILQGSGIIEVDFRVYNNWKDKIIYLEKNQYIKFLSDDFEVRFIHFPNEIVFKFKDARILFKHLISLGYINYKESSACDFFQEEVNQSSDLDQLIDISVNQWYKQNPFRANKDEYQIIFDIKEIIDEGFVNTISIDDLKENIRESKEWDIKKLLKNKLGITLRKMIARKQFVESQKALAFTNDNIQEIAYDKGYKDPAYFNRVFQRRLGQTPREFRENFGFKNRDRFSENIVELIQSFHAEEHNVDFYAGKMNLSSKALSRKVKDRMNITLGQLIRFQLMNSAKKMLEEGGKVTEVAYALGFNDLGHFSRFFTRYTGKPPSNYKN